jgi:hypothetical protein
MYAALQIRSVVVAIYTFLDTALMLFCSCRRHHFGDRLFVTHCNVKSLLFVSIFILSSRHQPPLNGGRLVIAGPI